MRYSAMIDPLLLTPLLSNATELDKAWVMRIDNHPLCPAECRVQKWGHTFERDRG